MLLWLVVMRMQPQPDMLSETLRPEMVSSGVGDLWVVMIEIETPNPLHTHIRSSLYIYNAIQHLLLWLVVIRM
jgi:hypothetical protein